MLMNTYELPTKNMVCTVIQFGFSEPSLTTFGPSYRLLVIYNGRTHGDKKR